MTSAPARLAAFAALLVAVFAGAALLGGAVDPEGTSADAGHNDQPAAVATGHGADDGADDGAGEDASHGAGEEAGAHGGGTTDAALPGLAVAAGGLRLVVERPVQPRDADAALRFRLVDEHGEDVRDLDVAHEKRLHLIVVRRDVRHFQHLHPEQAADGSWTATADLSEAGTYRVFTDVTRDGVQQTLGTDVHVPGAYAPRAVPAPSTEVRDDRGLTVRLRRDGARVSFDVLRDGEVIDDELQPYLGAKGHLVTLRLGDLAYLHTHPEGDELAFETELPSAGQYRLWVQFQLDGTIHTAAFTQEVAS